MGLALVITLLICAVAGLIAGIAMELLGVSWWLSGLAGVGLGYWIGNRDRRERIRRKKP